MAKNPTENSSGAVAAGASVPPAVSELEFPIQCPQCSSEFKEKLGRVADNAAVCPDCATPITRDAFATLLRPQALSDYENALRRFSLEDVRERLPDIRQFFDVR